MSESKPFSTCDQCDPHRDGAPAGFAAQPPVFRDFGGLKRFSGQVVTVKCHEDNTSVRATLETPGAGRVLVVAGGGSLRTALVGGNIGVLAEKNGWAGVLVDGCVRDVEELAQCQVGIRALGSMPMPPRKNHVGLVDVPVQVQGVTVRPGDWLYADADGIVISDVALS